MIADLLNIQSVYATAAAAPTSVLDAATAGDMIFKFVTDIGVVLVIGIALVLGLLTILICLITIILSMFRKAGWRKLAIIISSILAVPFFLAVFF